MLHKNQSLEKRIQQLESQLNELQITANHTIPLQISKAADKALSSCESLREELENELMLSSNKEEQRITEVKDGFELVYSHFSKETGALVEQVKQDFQH